MSSFWFSALPAAPREMTLNALLTEGPMWDVLVEISSTPPLHSDVPGVSESWGPLVWFRFVMLPSLAKTISSRGDFFLMDVTFQFDTWKKKKNRRRHRQKAEAFQIVLVFVVFLCVLLCSCAVLCSF